MNNCYKKIRDQFGLERMEPSRFVEKACQKLGYSPAVLRAAKITAENFSKLALLEGRRPQTIAGVSLFMTLTLVC